MPIDDLAASLARAEARLGVPGRRRERSDRGRPRLSPEALRVLEELAAGQERPKMSALLRQLALRCAKPPSRASVYNHLDRLRTPERVVGELPAPVRRALYNLVDESRAPEAQIAFYCFNYGDVDAMSFAAGLPWLALHQARRMRGWRPKSRGLLDAVARARRI